MNRSQPKSRSSRLVGGALAALLAVPLALAACQVPSQVTLEVVGEVPFREGMGVAVQVARVGEAEGAPRKTFTDQRWAFGQTIGTVVLAPGDAVTEADVRVVLALGRAPESCTADDSAGCVVYRRRVTFEDGQTTVRAVLRGACFGVFCDAGSSCREDRSCGPITSEDRAVEERTPAPADPYGAAVIASRPRHYYRFDEREGSKVAHDEMGHADGVYEGAKLGVTGALASGGGAVYFDGVGARMLVPKLEELPGALTIEAWVRSDGADPDDPVLLQRLDARTNGRLFGYRLTAPSRLSVKLEIYRDTERIVSDGSRLTDGFGFMHVAAVAEAGKIRVYVDGRLEREESYPDGPLPPSGVPLLVGAGTAAHFRGAIDELALYDHALDAATIREHVRASFER